MLLMHEIEIELSQRLTSLTKNTIIICKFIQQIGEYTMKKLEEYVRTIPDFPEPGIMFRDVTSVLQDADGLHLAIDTMQDLIKDLDYDVVAGAESRGFIFGTPIAYNNHKPFVLIRKKGKLPSETVSVDYDLEYGKATIEMHKDSIKPGQRVLVVDDLIATGGTTQAMIKLIESLGGVVVGVVVMMELAGLKGRERLAGYRLDSAITYEGK
jgi:adenine phosphoribosyltransferase